MFKSTDSPVVKIASRIKESGLGLADSDHWIPQ